MKPPKEFTAKAKKIIRERSGGMSNEALATGSGIIKSASKEYSNTPRGLTLNQGLVDWRATVNGTRNCIADGCDRAAQCLDRTVCLMHYKRFKRHGDLTTVGRKWSPPNPDKAECAVTECSTAEDGASGYCKMHGTRLRRHGNPIVTIATTDRAFPVGGFHYAWSGSNATYRAMHQRVKKLRGKASDYACVDCGQNAAQWSYDHSDESQIDGHPGPYSIDANRYRPMCVKCHKGFDMARIMGLKS